MTLICCIFFVAAACKQQSPVLPAGKLAVEQPPRKPESQSNELPGEALILEKQKINSKTHPNRELVLWMLNAEKHPFLLDAEDPYTCPEETKGSFYRGATRFSLLNSETNKIINTIEIKKDYWDEGKPVDDEFDVPYSIRKNDYYFVPELGAKGEGKPKIMRLQDINGDGKAFEFPLYVAEGCPILQTTLIGYSERQDKVIQYPVELKTTVNGKADSEDRVPYLWVDQLFAVKPIRSGFWRYKTDYTGYGGWLAKCQVRYNQKQEKFEGVRNIIKSKEDDK